MSASPDDLVFIIFDTFQEAEEWRAKKVAEDPSLGVGPERYVIVDGPEDGQASVMPASEAIASGFIDEDEDEGEVAE